VCERILYECEYEYEIKKYLYQTKLLY